MKCNPRNKTGCMKLVDIPWLCTDCFWTHKLTLWTSTVCLWSIIWIYDFGIFYWWIHLFILRLQYLSLPTFSYVQIIFLHIKVGSSYHIYQLADFPIQAWYHFWPDLPYQKNWWFGWSYFTGRICGSWHRAFGGFWEYSTTGWPEIWGGGNHG